MLSLIKWSTKSYWSHVLSTETNTRSTQTIVWLTRSTNCCSKYRDRLAVGNLGQATGARKDNPLTDISPQTLSIETTQRKIAAGRYLVDSIHTRVLFKVRHFGVSDYWGEFLEPEGWLDIDPASPEKTSLQVSVPTARVRTNSAHLDDELRSAEWFDADQFASITLTGRGIKVVNGERAVFEGDFSLHGVTKRVGFNVDFIGAGVNPFKGTPTIGFEASATISRTEFGVSAKYPIVGDKVSIIVSAAFDFA
ncbi:polyisoprenoid-binding protein [Rhizobium leguminosarum bv. viciae]|nr:polyisoprenoid-binding protein [Rhizobium leguminosarum bv. viciae]TCA92781.1 polyisoprenoid-binding protein [Rhizobium leguminosarum bv. viciae]